MATKTGRNLEVLTTSWEKSKGRGKRPFCRQG